MDARLSYKILLRKFYNIKRFFADKFSLDLSESQTTCFENCFKIMDFLAELSLS